MESIRERAIKALVERFENQRQGAPTSDPYDFRWDAVVRHPIGQAEERKRWALAVLEGDEQKKPRVACVDCLLPVELEFRVLLDSQDEPAECLNEVLLNIQRKIREDISLGELVVDVRELGNTHIVESFLDRKVEGSVFIEIQYHHDEADPRAIRHGVVP